MLLLLSIDTSVFISRADYCRSGCGLRAVCDSWIWSTLTSAVVMSWLTSWVHSRWCCWHCRGPLCRLTPDEMRLLRTREYDLVLIQVNWLQQREALWRQRLSWWDRDWSKFNQSLLYHDYSIDTTLFIIDVFICVLKSRRTVPVQVSAVNRVTGGNWIH